MIKKHCEDVKTLLEELQGKEQQLTTLYNEIDKSEDLEQHKKLIEQTQEILRRNKKLMLQLQAWEKRSRLSQRIDAIEKKTEAGEELSVGDLRILYEIDFPVFKSFPRDPFHTPKATDRYHKIDVIIEKRMQEQTQITKTKNPFFGTPLSVKTKERMEQIKEDHARIYGCRVDQVGESTDDLRNNDDMVVFLGNIPQNHFQKIDRLPKTLKHVIGNLDLIGQSNITALPEGLEYVGGHLELNETIKSLPNGLRFIGKDLGLNKHIKTLPESIEHVGNNLHLPASPTHLPKKLSYVGGRLDTRRTTIQDLPETLTHVGGDLLLNNSISRLPNNMQHIGGSLNLYFNDVMTQIPDSLVSINRLTLNEKWEKTDKYTELITCVETQKIVKETVQFGI